MENVGTEETKNVTRSRTKDMKVESRRNIRDDPCKEVRPSRSRPKPLSVVSAEGCTCSF